MSAPPPNEEARLQTLAAYDILDTPPEEDFDNIVRLAARICGCPVAAVTLIDRDRQWFKSALGFPAAQTGRDVSFRARAILQPRLLHVPDTALDPRFRHNPFVTGGPHVRFYAGAPLVMPGGHALGALCVLDRFPRALAPEQREALEDLSRMVGTLLDLRKTAAEQRRTLAEQALLADALQSRERQIQTLTDNVPVMIARVDADRRYVFANRAFQDQLDVPRDQVIGRTMREVLGGTAYEAVRPYVDRVLAGEEVHYAADLDYRTVGRRSVSVSYIPEVGPDRSVSGFVLSAADVTERVQTEETLRQRTELLESVLAAIPHQVFWKDRDLVYRGCNANFARAAGLADPAEIVGRRDADLAWTPDEAASYRRDDLRVLASGAALLDYEETNVRDDGSVAVGLTSKLPLHDSEGRVTGLLGVSQDITGRRALEAERERLLADMERLLAAAVARADLDPLTGLLNHRAFQRRLEEEADRAQREGATLAVAMLDLDNFKFFNDAYGHLAGDDVLRRVAEDLRRQCRSYDTLARFGGDEFAVLMPGLTAADAAGLTQRILDHLGGRGYAPPGGDAPVPLSLSAGVAVFPTEALSRLDALAMADERLRLAKTGGDAAVRAALDLRTEMSRRIEGFSMLDALVTAVANKDRYTRRHSEDVLTYSLQVARELRLDEKTRQTIAVAALLHDVGKIGVPDAVLRKPGKLTDDEFDAMKQHPMMGAVIVGAVPGFEGTLDAIRHHHERWDGQGYPFGLRAEETPLLARLLAVADAFSAMTTDRPYRKGLDEAQALAILQEGSGTQWDPVCVRAFLRACRAGSENPVLETGPSIPQ